MTVQALGIWVDKEFGLIIQMQQGDLIYRKMEGIDTSGTPKSKGKSNGEY